MPELPEVETVVRDLRPALVGRRFATIESGRQALRRPWRREWEPALCDVPIRALKRRGKWIVIELEDAYHLVVHLGMTGQLTVVPANTERKNHTHLVFTLDDQRQLRFRDIRRFGSATLFVGERAVEDYFRKSGLGPEPFDLRNEQTARTWWQAVKASKRNLKAILLDQTIVAGVGNIYADESLFQARLHPERRGSSLTAAVANVLKDSIIDVLERAIVARGSTIRDYIGGSGLKGGFQEEFFVYGRTGEPCRMCQTAIKCIRLAGRSTHFCPNCQRRKR